MSNDAKEIMDERWNDLLKVVSNKQAINIELKNRLGLKFAKLTNTHRGILLDMREKLQEVGKDNKEVIQKLFDIVNADRQYMFRRMVTVIVLETNPCDKPGEKLSFAQVADLMKK